MSSKLHSWATHQVVRPATAKLLLLVLADHANPESGRIFPSIARLVAFTSLNRKTVIAAIQRLIELRILTVTEERCGRTNQIKVYRINQKWGGATVPKTGGKDADFGTAEESRKRDTEPSRGEPRRQGDSPPNPHDSPPTDLFGEPLSPETMSDDEIVAGYVDRWTKLDAPALVSQPRPGPDVRVDLLRRVEERVPSRERAAVDALLDDVFDRIGASRWLRGEGTDGWRPAPSWPVKKKNFSKIMEGYYGRDRDHRSQPSNDPGRSFVAAGHAALELVRASRRAAAAREGRHAG